LKIFFDENFSKYLAAGISELQLGVRHEGFEVVHSVSVFGKGISDEAWIPQVARMHGIVITHDISIQRTPALWRLCMDYQLGIFFVKPPKSYKYWDIVQLMIKKWAEIKDKANTSRTPYGYIVTPKKIDRISL
jgi:PIN like domain